jgi:hypothetical protein
VTYRRAVQPRTAPGPSEAWAAIETGRSVATDHVEAPVGRAVGSASETTGREMAVSDVSIERRQVSQPDATFGEITYCCEWPGTPARRSVRDHSIDPPRDAGTY